MRTNRYKGKKSRFLVGVARPNKHARTAIGEMKQQNKNESAQQYILQAQTL